MRATLIATFGLVGLFGAFCSVSTLEASEAETVSSQAAVAKSSSQGTPVIQFETTFFDFGKLAAPGKVSGVFKFKNAGNGVLKVDPPKPSCGCTDAKVKPNTLAPGESSEISYTIELDHLMGQVQKHISVYSNDPKTPDVQLTMQLDYTPLYDLNPKVLRILLPPDKEKAQGAFIATRNDGKPSKITRLISSQPWVSAALDPSFKGDANSDRVNVTVRRPAIPSSMIMANIQLWASDQTNQPVQTLSTYCEFQGELSATPPQTYWVIPNFGSSTTNHPTEALTHTVKLKSVLNQPVTIQNVTTSIEGMSAQVVAKDAGKTFDLILKFDQLPREYVSGKVTVETSTASLPSLEVPVTIAVSQ